MSRSSSAVVIRALLLATERAECGALDTRGNAEPGFDSLHTANGPTLRYELTASTELGAAELAATRAAPDTGPSSRAVLRRQDAQVVCVPVVDPAASAEWTLHHY
jgi:hypothetical protein